MSDFEETNLFAQQEANRRKSRWIVVSFILFFAWLGFGADAILYFMTRQGKNPVPWTPGFPLIGLVLMAIAAGLVYYSRRHAAEKVLWATGARRLGETPTEAERRYQNVAEEMSIAAGITLPGIWVVDDPDPNAFATGDDPSRSHIAVTTGLIDTLSRDELQAVIGHEYGHIKNLDTQLMTFLAGLVGAVLLLREGMGRYLFFGGRLGGGRSRDRGSRDKDGGGGALAVVLLAVWVLSWILAPLVLNMLALWVSRKREYLADAMSAQFTRNPLSLATALEKIEGAHAPTKAIKAGAAHLCIADPLGRRLTSSQSKLADAFATHPPMSVRISRLKAMAFQAQKREAAGGAKFGTELPTSG